MLNVTRIAGVANLLLGAWLMLSALLFRNMPAQAFNVLLIGGAAVALALVSLRWGRFFEAGNVILAVWLFVSPIVIPGGSVWLVVNHFFIASLLFGFAGPALAAPADELDELA